MKIPGYDEWKLSGPPEWEGPTCDWCGGNDDIRVVSEGQGWVEPTLSCEDCFDARDDGPRFDDLQTAQEYYEDEADARADYLYEQLRDRLREDAP